MPQRAETRPRLVRLLGPDARRSGEPLPVQVLLLQAQPRQRPEPQDRRVRDSPAPNLPFSLLALVALLVAALVSVSAGRSGGLRGERGAGAFVLQPQCGDVRVRQHEPQVGGLGGLLQRVRVSGGDVQLPRLRPLHRLPQPPSQLNRRPRPRGCAAREQRRLKLFNLNLFKLSKQAQAAGAEAGAARGVDWGHGGGVRRPARPTGIRGRASVRPNLRQLGGGGPVLGWWLDAARPQGFHGLGQQRGAQLRARPRAAQAVLPRRGRRDHRGARVVESGFGLALGAWGLEPRPAPPPLPLRLGRASLRTPALTRALASAHCGLGCLHGCCRHGCFSRGGNFFSGHRRRRAAAAALKP
mmetsp:Transcript_51887/g.104123  ORF Transcript_51887/g.104123 Transcript_51887/m.104123 type:complete len:355 (+) Transcript_51887:547-1611(+)